MSASVLLVHGWGGSFEATWQRSGFSALLEDAGRRVIAVDLLGHGQAPKPHQPEAYVDLAQRLVDVLPDEPVDAIGFSLGALTLIRLAGRTPERFRSLVLAGVGRNVLERDVERGQRVLAAVEGRGDPDDTASQVFAQYARQPGNDPKALAAVLRAPIPVITADEVRRVTCRTLVIIGDRDSAGPADDLLALLPDGSLKVLRNVDHFATPEAFGFIDASLEFIGAVPQ